MVGEVPLMTMIMDRMRVMVVMTSKMMIIMKMRKKRKKSSLNPTTSSRTKKRRMTRKLQVVGHVLLLGVVIILVIRLGEGPQVSLLVFPQGHLFPGSRNLDLGAVAGVVLV